MKRFFGNCLWLALPGLFLMIVAPFAYYELFEAPAEANYNLMQAVPWRDKMTGAALAIDTEHSMIHGGHSFTAQYESVAPLPTLVGEETAMGFITPVLPTRIHMTVDAWADDESVFEIRELPTIVLDSGDEEGPNNRQRALPLVPSGMSGHQAVQVADRVTTYTVLQANAANLVAAGAVLHHETLAIAAGPPFASKLNTVSRGQREFILRPDTAYCVILTNSTANPTVHNIILNWYEHIDSNY